MATREWKGGRLTHRDSPASGAYLSAGLQVTPTVAKAATTSVVA
jgi:hypothetical protein